MSFKYDGSNWRLYTPGWKRKWWIYDHEWEAESRIKEYKDFLASPVPPPSLRSVGPKSLQSVRNHAVCTLNLRPSA